MNLLHLLYKRMGIKKKHRYFVPITLKKSYRVISCGRHVSDAAIASFWHEPEIEQSLNEITEGTFLDIGAHIGRFTIQVAHQLKGKGRVVAIEAQPQIFAKLYNNISINNLENAIAFFSAAADKDGTIKFYTDNLGVAGGHSIASKIITENSRELTFPAKSVDSLIKELKIKDLSWIKLDVECAEDMVLKGAVNSIKKFKPKILFEAMNQEEYDKVMKHLKKFGYKTKKLSSINYLAEVKK